MGFAATAWAGSSAVDSYPYDGNPWYYGETGLDGIIHCAAGNAEIQTELPDRGMYGQAVSGAGKNLFCAATDSLPGGYIQVNTTILDNTNYICAGGSWVQNSGYAFKKTRLVTANANICGIGIQYRTYGQHNIAVNLGWRYGSEYTSLVNGG